MLKNMITLLVLVVWIIGLARCDRETGPGPVKQYEKITIAVTPWPGSAALYVAREKGFLKDEGLEIDFHSYISGHLGLAAMFTGKTDLATAGDTPIARAALEGKPVALIATLCEINRAVLIVARKDRGIISAGDLSSKKVGVVEGTTAHFFLDIFLTTSYINPADVRIVNLETDQVVDALVRGEVDAVCTWSPHTITARDRLGDNAVILEDPSIYKMTWNLTTTKAFAENHPERISKVLRAIVRANKFIAGRPDETRTITSKRIGTGSPFFNQEWEDYSFTAALDQSLILNLEDQVRWMVRQEDRVTHNMPNVMDFIYSNGLKAVQPAGLGIVGK